MPSKLFFLSLLEQVFCHWVSPSCGLHRLWTNCGLDTVFLSSIFSNLYPVLTYSCCREREWAHVLLPLKTEDNYLPVSAGLQAWLRYIALIFRSLRGVQGTMWAWLVPQAARSLEALNCDCYDPVISIVVFGHKLCPTLCDAMDCSTPGFPVLHYLLEFAQTHVHWVSDAIQPSHPLSPLSPPAFNLSHIWVFSNQSALCIRWPKYWSFSFSISPSNE